MATIGEIFGLSKRRVEGYGGAMPLESLTKTPEGALVSKTLQDRLAGRGVGFQGGNITDYVKPFAAQRRAALTEQELPAISAQASARGLGRSTIPVSRAALSTQAAERDISEREASLRLADEQQRRSEINSALNALQQFAGTEATLANARYGAESGEFARQQGLREQREAGQLAGLMKLLQVSAPVAGALLGGAAGVAGGAMGIPGINPGMMAAQGSMIGSQLGGLATGTSTPGDFSTMMGKMAKVPGFEQQAWSIPGMTPQGGGAAADIGGVSLDSEDIAELLQLLGA